MVTGGSKPHPPQCNIRRHPFKRQQAPADTQDLARVKHVQGIKRAWRGPKRTSPPQARKHVKHKLLRTRKSPTSRPRSKGPTRGTLQQQPEPLAPCIVVSQRCCCCQLLPLLLLHTFLQPSSSSSTAGPDNPLWRTTSRASDSTKDTGPIPGFAAAPTMLLTVAAAAV